MVATASPGLDVFVSHSASECDAAATVAKYLSEGGISVALDQDIVRGTDWQRELRKTLAGSDAFVIIVQPDHTVSQNTAFELGAALALHKPIFVVNTNGKSGQLPAFLQR